MKADYSVLTKATVDVYGSPVSLRRSDPEVSIVFSSSSQKQGVYMSTGFFVLAFRMGFNGGGFMNVWENKVLWFFFFSNITKEPVFQGFLKGVACHGFYIQDWFSCLLVPGVASDSFFL